MPSTIPYPILGVLQLTFHRLSQLIQQLHAESAEPLFQSVLAASIAFAQQSNQLHHTSLQATAHSLSSFLHSMSLRPITVQDRVQLQLLLDNIRHDLEPNHNLLSPPYARLITEVSASLPTSNSRIALLTESRAISAMLHAQLQQAGFSPRTLTSMEQLATATPEDYPMAIIADLTLCQNDQQTCEIIFNLRERLSPPPHLFCLASHDDVKARLAAVRLGATRFLKKPVDIERLIAILRGVTAQIPTAPFRALFVDDDITMTRIYHQAMTEIGIEVRTLNNPLQAPALVEAFAPDVIITDLYMPGCNGLELAALFRQDEALADIPILFLSSETDIQRQMRALDLGGDDFLTKPVQIPMLRAAVIARAKRSRMLKRSHHDYQQVVEHLQRIELAMDRHSLISIADLNGQITYVNPLFCDTSGYSRDELIGANHRIIRSNHHPPEFYQHLWQTIRSGQIWHGELCNRRKDGGHYWVETTIMPQLDELGVPLCYISVRTDITSLKELQTQLMIAKSEAEAASQAKTIFLAHISHELKTPLNSVLGFSLLLLEEQNPPPTDDQREMLTAIAQSGRHLLRLINDLVDLAKIETGHMGLTMEPVDLVLLIHESLGLVRPQAQQRGIRFDIESIPEHLRDACYLYADRIRVKQVLLNLLSNAIKYNRDGGVIAINCLLYDGLARIAIRDSGSGITAADQERLFLPFSRLHHPTAKIEGSGIGLSLSKSLIQRMNGHIGVNSEVGVGSEFWFELPLVERSGQPEREAELPLAFEP